MNLNLVSLVSLVSLVVNRNQSDSFRRKPVETTRPEPQEPHLAEMPPSSLSSAPVMNLLSSEAR